MTRPMNMAGSLDAPGLAHRRRRMLSVPLLNYIGNLKLAIFFQRLWLESHPNTGNAFPEF